MTVPARTSPLGSLALWFATVGLVAGMASLIGPAKPAAADPATCVSAARPVGPFHISGDHRTVLDASNHTFISYGTTVPGLSDPNLTKAPEKDKAKIDATARQWCGNTVRLQVSQYAVTHNRMPNDPGTCQDSYLSHALDPEVQRAEHDGLVVVINDQTESDPHSAEERGPTRATFTFWNCVAAHHERWRASETYAQDGQVIFDIFNEPRVDACENPNGQKDIYPPGKPNAPYNMNVWRNGTSGDKQTGGKSDGTCGAPEVYQGMEAVAYHIRVDDHAHNLLWVEGPGVAGTLAGLGQPDCGATPTHNCFLNPSLNPIVYAVHHPYGSDPTNPKSPPADSATWWKEFGWVVDHPAASGHAPVVIGEWTNFDAFFGAKPSPGGSCWSDAPTAVPNFLAYLKRLGVGLNAYQLSGPPAGFLLKADEDWNDPSNYTDAPWLASYCTDSTDTPLLGAGADIQQWFRQQNGSVGPGS
jgi:Cellulase (glycosyl hydrolase family 5)